jgi:glutaredoxin-like protein NrdH
MRDKATVYGKPGCVQCKYTTKMMDTEQIPYVYLDITVNEVANEAAKSYGRTALPIVVAGEQVWQGFSPDKIKGLNRDNS